MAEDILIMSSKRSKKVKKRQKALQRRRQHQPTSSRHPVTQIPPEYADQLAMTTTGEIMQPIRLHYEVLDGEHLRTTFAKLSCIEHDTPRRRWVWLYMEEARGLSFKQPSAADHTVLGEFVFKGTDEIVLNLRSIGRATQAVAFFDKHIPRTVVRIMAVTVSNRFLKMADASTLTNLDAFFDRADVVVQDPASLVETLKDMATSIPDERERLSAVKRYMDERAKRPVPAMERFPFDYEDYDLGGISTVEARFAPHSVIAMQHWQGNTDYTRHHMIQNMLRDSVLPKGETDTMSMTATSTDASISAQLCSLMRSDDYEDWLQAWELLRDAMPESIATFDALEAQFAFDIHDCSVTEMFYELEMALHNEGLDDFRLMTRCAELARWVYTHFTAESELNLGNFRGYEAESLWEMNQTQQAETLFQELIEVFPNFAWGYIWWDDCYWMSDWSYEHAPDYDRAESLYRQALANPDLDDQGDVQDRLDMLNDEKIHPEKRERFKQDRLKRIQERKSLE
jgi:tetratricopeptide (TPR) repeat protein